MLFHHKNIRTPRAVDPLSSSYGGDIFAAYEQHLSQLESPGIGMGGGGRGGGAGAGSLGGAFGGSGGAPHPFGIDTTPARSREALASITEGR